MSSLDPNASADAALMGGAKADAAFGVPQPYPVAGLRYMPGSGPGSAPPPPDPTLLRMRANVAGMQAALRPAAPPRELEVGYDQASDTIFAGGKQISGSNLSQIAAADQQGLFNTQGEIPPGMARVPVSQIRQWVTKQAENRGAWDATKEVGKQALAGVADIGSIAAKDLAMYSPKGSWGEQAGAAGATAIDKAMERYQPDVYKRGEVSSALIQGARSAAPSVAAMGAGALGTAFGGPAGTAAAATGIAAAFGGAQAWDTYQKALAAGKSPDEARTIAMQTGAIEGTGEAVGDIVGGKLLASGGKWIGGKFFKGAADEMIAGKAWARPALGNVAGNAAVQAGTEYGQGYGEAAVEKAANISNEDPHEQGMAGFKSGLGLSALLAPFGLGAGYMQHRQRAQDNATLTDPNAPAAQRYDAALRQTAVIAQLKSPAEAKAYFSNFLELAAKRENDLLATSTPVSPEPTGAELSPEERMRASGGRMAASEVLAMLDQMEAEGLQQVETRPTGPGGIVQNAPGVYTIPTEQPTEEVGRPVTSTAAPGITTQGNGVYEIQPPAPPAAPLVNVTTGLFGQPQPVTQQVLAEEEQAPGTMEPLSPSGVSPTAVATPVSSAPATGQGVSLVDIPYTTASLAPGATQVTRTNGKAKVIDAAGRKIVVVSVNGKQIPFYLSTGNAGKKNVPAGKWYPVLGMGKDGWIAKGSAAQLAAYYHSPGLRAIGEHLDRTIGDIRSAAHPQVTVSGAHNDFINSLFSTAAPENETKGAKEALSARLAEIIGAVDGVAGQEATKQERPSSSAPATPNVTPAKTAEAQEQAISEELDALLADERAASAGLGMTNQILQSATRTAPGSKPRGKISIVKEALAGIVRSLASAPRADGTHPTPLIYMPGTATMDKGKTAAFAQKMNSMRDAAVAVINAYHAYSDKAGNIIPTESKVAEGPGTREKGAVTKAAELRVLAQQLKNAVDNLVAVSGSAANANALVAAFKTRAQEGLTKGTPSVEKAKRWAAMDVGLSRAWKLYNDGVLDNTENLVQVSTGDKRNSWEQDKRGGAEAPLKEAADTGVKRNVGPKTKAEKGIMGVLAYLQSHGNTPYERMLASAVGRALRKTDKMPKVVFDVKPGEHAAYDPSTDTIHLRETSSAEEALHEALHAALQWVVYTQPNNPAVQQLRQALKDLMAYDREKLTSENAKNAYDIIAGLVKKGGAGNLNAAMLELVSYGNTMPDFAAALRGIPSTQDQQFKSLATKLFDMLARLVQKFLGVSNTVANDVLQATMRLLEDSTMSSRAEAFGEAGKGQKLNLVDIATAAFKRWFGGSKVVDAKGEPLVVYHGMPEEMEGGEFRSSKYGTMGEGIYFTNDPKAASNFATGKRYPGAEEKQQGSVLPVYLRMEHPFDDNFFVGNKAWQEWAASFLLGGEDPSAPWWTYSAATRFQVGTREESQKIIKALYDKLMAGEATVADLVLVNGTSETPWGKKIIPAIRAHGAFDGFILKNSAKGFNEYVVFKPEQAKSATGNRGTFDPTKGDILYAAVSSSTQPQNAVQPGMAPNRSYAKSGKTLWDKISTEFIFKALGWDKVPSKVLDASGKVAETIKESSPTLTRWIGYVNANFGVPIPLREALLDYKTDRHIGAQMTDLLANYIESKSRTEVMALIDYLDGNTKALDAYPTMKDVADMVARHRAEYIAEIRDTKTREFYENLKFSEAMVFAKGTEGLASRALGARKLNELLRHTSETIAETDFHTPYDAQGNPILDGNYVRMLEASGPNAGKLAGFYHVDLINKNGVPAGMVPEQNGLQWRFDRKSGKDQMKMSAVRSARYAIEQENKVNEVANALRNTMSILAANYASNRLTDALAEDGGKLGVVFDDVKSLEKFLGPGKKVSPDSILPLSASIAKSSKVQGWFRSKHQWVRIPNGPTYGALAGKLVNGSVWASIEDMTDRRPIHNIDAVHGAMRIFKKAKTIYNPGTHLGNVGTNFTLAMMHDIPMTTVGSATRMLFQYATNPDAMNKQERDLVHQFMNSGAMLGDYSSIEVKKALYDAMKGAVEQNEPEGISAKIAGWLRVEAAKKKAIAEWAKFEGHYPAAAGVLKKATPAALDKKMTELYAAEDNAFRFAAFLSNLSEQATGLGGPQNLSEREYRAAGTFARDAFLDYDIDSKAVKILRSTALPFISWTYAILPVLGHIALHKPWKLANVMLGYYLIEQAMAAAAGDDDEELRKRGPEYIRNRLFGIGPYAHIRIPFMGDDQNPVYFKLGAYIPLGNVADPMPNGFLGIKNWPQQVSPNGPFISAILGAVGGIDPYTGKPLSQPTASDWEAFLDRSAMLGKQFTPPWSPAAADVLGIVRGAPDKGYTGADTFAGLKAARDIGGLKLYQYNVKESEAQQQRAAGAIKSEFQKEIAKLRRAEMRYEEPDWEGFNKRRDELLARRNERIKEVKGEE